MRDAALAVLFSSGCSALFMEKVPPKFNAQKHEPQCTATKGFAVWDGLQAGGWAIAVLASIATMPEAIETPRGEPKIDDGRDTHTTVAILGGAMALFHTISAVKGGGWADECRAARMSRASIVEEPPPKAKAAPVAVTPSPPRGFYCTSAGDVGLCARERAQCETGHAAIAMTVADVSACALVESAWCFRDRCFPSEAVCVAQRDRAGSEEPCVEAM